MKTVDLSYLYSITDEDPKLTQELVDIFKVQIPEYIEEFETAIATKNALMMSRVAHKAKASVQIFGLKELANRLNELEIEAQANIYKDEYAEILSFFDTRSREALEELKSLGY